MFINRNLVVEQENIPTNDISTNDILYIICVIYLFIKFIISLEYIADNICLFIPGYVIINYISENVLKLKQNEKNNLVIINSLIFMIYTGYHKFLYENVCF